jgi:hypothetical protein
MGKWRRKGKCNGDKRGDKDGFIEILTYPSAELYQVVMRLICLDPGAATRRQCITASGG